MVLIISLARSVRRVQQLVIFQLTHKVIDRINTSNVDIIEVYKNILDRVKPEQNGAITISEFNRKSKIAELRLIDFLSGDVAALQPPQPYLSQKNKDWLSKFIKPHKFQVSNGAAPKPDGYYLFESMHIIGSYKDIDDCEDEKLITGQNTTVTLLDSGAFETRANTYIKSLKPSYKKPIAQIVGDEFNFLPKDLGSVELKFIRYPVFGEVKVKVDQVYNEETFDEVNSIPYEWDFFAIDLLLYYISAQYSIGTREKSLVEQNELGGKLERK